MPLLSRTLRGETPIRRAFRILNLLGVERLNCPHQDSLADDDLREIVSLEIKDHLKGTFLESAPIIPVDSITGVGIDH